jgi:hypothetical protein
MSTGLAILSAPNDVVGVGRRQVGVAATGATDAELENSGKPGGEAFTLAP